jgi:AcrR family transcriptional regulator
MPDDVKLPTTSPTTTRSYNATNRRAAAEETRHSVIEAARECFLKLGYRRTTMAVIAGRAGVAIDTIYATCGKKPEILRELIERAISGQDAAIPALQRAYVQEIQAIPDAGGKLRRYARAIREIQPRLAPLMHVLHDAGSATPELESLWQEIADRRAANMRILAAELVATGQIRQELSIDEVADTIWVMNGPEFYTMLVDERGWSFDRFESWLADTWIRLLLDPDAPTSTGPSGTLSGT